MIICISLINITHNNYFLTFFNRLFNFKFINQTRKLFFICLLLFLRFELFIRWKWSFYGIFSSLRPMLNCRLWFFYQILLIWIIGSLRSYILLLIILRCTWSSPFHKSISGILFQRLSHYTLIILRKCICCRRS